MGIITILCKMPHPRPVLTNKFDNNKEYIFTGSSDGIIRMFTCKDEADKEGDKHPYKVLKDPQAEMSSVTSIGVSKEADFITVSYCDGWIKYWDITSNTCLRTIKEARGVMGLSQSPNDNKFLTLGDDGIMHYYDTETGKKVRSFLNSVTVKHEGHSSKVFSACFHPMLVNEFVSGGWDNTVQFWDLRKATSVRYILGPHISGEGLDINAQGNLLVSTSYRDDSALELWEYKTGKLFFNIDNERNKLYCGRWVTSMYLISGSTDPSCLRIVDLHSFRTLSQFRSIDSGIYSVDIDKQKPMGILKNSDEELNAYIVFCSGNNAMYAKLEYFPKNK